MFSGMTYSLKSKDVCDVISLVNPLIACLFFILTETWFCWVSSSTPTKGLVWSQCKSRCLSHRNWISRSCLCPPALCGTNEAFEISQHSDSVDYYGYDYTESLLAWKTRHPVRTGNSEFNPAGVKFRNAVRRDTTEAGEERVINIVLWQRVLKWYYDENRIFLIWAILKHKQVDVMSRKMLFTVFNYLKIFIPGIFKFLKYAN